MNLREWIEIRNEDYEREHPPDFVTHLNYVRWFNALSQNLKIECKKDIKNKIKESKQLIKKLHLVELLRKNLQEEYRLILGNPSFAEVCVPWIAVKSYYLIFNLFLVWDYLISGQESSFISSHKAIIKKFKEYFEKEVLVFNKDIFNINKVCSKLYSLKIKSGTNIKLKNIDSEDKIALIFRKLLFYKLEDFQREEKIKNFRTKNNQEKKRAFLADNTINLCEFFYWYRIKSNYRDLEFLDQDIEDDQFLDFYRNYFEAADNFYKLFRLLINELSIKRFEKKIL